MDEIREHLLAHMRERGVSMADLSRRLKKNNAYVQQFISGKQQSLPYEERLIIAEFLDMNPTALGVAPARSAIVQPNAAGFSQDATPYVAPSGHYLSNLPRHYWMLTQLSNSLDQHEQLIRKGDVIVFDLNAIDPAQLKPMTIVAVQMASRTELTQSQGTLTRAFIPPNKLITNSSERNEIISLDDDDLPFVPVLRGSFHSVIRGLN